MTIQQLLAGKTDCACGRSHVCPIASVIIERDACRHLPDLVAEYSRILLVADENTYAACGERVERALGARIADRQIYPAEPLLVPDERAIAALRARVSGGTELILGIGSGVINDLCKIVSYDEHLPYMIVATAPSMDGYASRGAALILDGMKVTLSADVPRAIVADVDVLAAAPMDMIRAGYGDIIGKYSCLNDWQLSHEIHGEYLCEGVLRATLEQVEASVALADGIAVCDPQAVGALMEALVAVGILMAYVGNSRPASGSEHHLSHYFEIVGITRGEPYLSHGIDVCCSAVETARLREQLLTFAQAPIPASVHDTARYEREIRRIYGDVADEVIALQNKMGWYGVDRVPVYREKWARICEILRRSPSSAQLLSLCERVGISYDAYRTLYGDAKIADGLRYAKDLKDRYTVLWLYYDLLGNS